MGPCVVADSCASAVSQRRRASTSATASHHQVPLADALGGDEGLPRHTSAFEFIRGAAAGGAARQPLAAMAAALYRLKTRGSDGDDPVEGEVNRRSVALAPHLSEEVDAAASARLPRHSVSMKQRRNHALHDFTSVAPRVPGFTIVARNSCEATKEEQPEQDDAQRRVGQSPPEVAVLSSAIVAKLDRIEASLDTFAVQLKDTATDFAKNVDAISERVEAQIATQSMANVQNVMDRLGKVETAVARHSSRVEQFTQEIELLAGAFQTHSESLDRALDVVDETLLALRFSHDDQYVQEVSVPRDSSEVGAQPSSSASSEVEVSAMNPVGTPASASDDGSPTGEAAEGSSSSYSSDAPDSDRESMVEPADSDADDAEPTSVARARLWAAEAPVCVSDMRDALKAAFASHRCSRPSRRRRHKAH